MERRFEKRLKNAVLAVFCFLIALSLAGGCAKKEEKPEAKAPQKQVKTVLLGVGLSTNPEKIKKLFTPLIDYLNEEIPDRHFQLKIIEYDASKALLEGELDIVLMGAFQYSTVRDNPEIALLAVNAEDQGGEESYLKRSVLIGSARRNVRTIEDIKGKTFGYSNETSATSYLLPLYYMASHGIDIEKDIEKVKLNEHDYTLQAVIKGEAAQVAGIPEAVFQRYLSDPTFPTLKDDVVVLARTDSIPNGPLVARSGLGSEFIDDVRHTLVKMHKFEKGRKALKAFGSASFVRVDGSEYEILTRMQETVFGESAGTE